MTLKFTGKARSATGGLWKRWLGRFVVGVGCAYLCAVGFLFFMSGSSGRLDASLAQSIVVGGLPLLIVALFALPGRGTGPSVLAMLAVALPHPTLF
ncbi:hypothetical protein [Gluconacetobacter takamatsuzukensis]|uniref:Uncharacterized protein n=1 Tax=Gluconacetobacter takamatsuzukensis TaxID=1286190 RepID=A0A7W4PSB3_9PROT|nr:hypothetical protein [Gluconacetobacter takamatsuzukensis]MBB2204761.1 hypothetical protein [Gluconacetobacter takamatsuzukensis]